MINVQSFENIPDFEAVRYLVGLAINDGHMYFFGNRSEKIGHDDAPEKGVIICRLIAYDKVLYFWDGLC